MLAVKALNPLPEILFRYLQCNCDEESHSHYAERMENKGLA